MMSYSTRGVVIENDFEAQHVLQNYMVCVNVVKAKDLIGKNSGVDGTFVKINLGKRMHLTRVKFHNESPFFDEYFVFDLRATKRHFLATNVIFTVMHFCRFKPKIIGRSYVDVCDVWSNADGYRDKWIPLTSDRSPDIVTGQLNVSVTVLSNGFGERNQNELIFDCMIRNRLPELQCKTNYIFEIYKYVEFPSTDDDKTIVMKNWKFRHNYYVRITINNISKTTRPTVISRNGELVWNHQMIFGDVTSKDVALIELCKPGMASKIIAVAEFDADLYDASRPKVFGPNYLNLYKPNRSGPNFIYTGSLLLSLEVCAERKKYLKAAEKNIKSIDESTERVTLFCSIIELSMLDVKLNRKAISIAVTLGTAVKLCDIALRDVYRVDGTQAEFTLQIFAINAIEKILCKSEMCLRDIVKHCEVSFDCQVSSSIYMVCEYIETEIEKILRCITISDDTINYYHQIYCLVNMIKKVYNKLRDDTDAIENKIQIDHAIDDVVNDVKSIYLKFTHSIDCMKKMIKTISCSWPDIVIWLICDDHPFAYHRIKSQDIVYSPMEKYCGTLCGKIQNVFVQPISCPSRCCDDSAGCYCISAKVEVVLWFGLSTNDDRFVGSCEYEIQSREENKKILIDTVTKLNCQVYIYRATLFKKYYVSDLFIKAYFNQHVRMTKVIKDNLNPMWNETLTFANVEIYATRDRLRDNPPLIVIEVYCGNIKNAELIGRIGVTPHVKLADASDADPILEWYGLYKGSEIYGKILMCSQIIESTNCRLIDDPTLKILRPKSDRFRIDVLFWGIRNLKNFHNLSRKYRKIKISVTIDAIELYSDTISDPGINANFHGNKLHKFFNAPVDLLFFPNIVLKLYTKTVSGKLTLVAYGFVDNPEKLFIRWMSKQDRIEALYSDKSEMSIDRMIVNDLIDDKDDKYETEHDFGIKNSLITSVMNILKRTGKKSDEIQLLEVESDDDATTSDVDDAILKRSDDWWSIYYKSIEDTDDNSPIQIFHCELESVSKYESFGDWCQSVNLHKATKDDCPLNICHVKCGIKICPWNMSDDVTPVSDNGIQLRNGYFKEFASNSVNNFIVRIYVVRCFNLRPKDARTNSCDPYLKIALGKNKINDVKNHRKNTVNPIFGRSYEIRCSFIDGYNLEISVYDHDVGSRDDFVGKTEIDLENRFYSKHRGSCGLAKIYKSTKWRDVKKPSDILNELCVVNHVDAPKYYDNCVVFNRRNYSTPILGVGIEIIENICLNILHSWESMVLFGYALVPQHVETRSLYHQKKYHNNEQGKIQMWIDIFPEGEGVLKPILDISPRVPEDLELRIIVWSTADVLLDEYDFFTGSRVSDIYIKAWLAERSSVQRTDIHYRSMTGEGLFNWRMIFPFEYSAAERKIVSGVDMLPAKLFLQAMDNDTLSRDDFLGSLTLNLNNCSRGAVASSACNIDALKGPFEDLFVEGRMRGWWPLTMRDSEGNIKITGKIDLEMQILSKRMADDNPVGKGRKSPNPLPKPERPEASFNWFLNPAQGLKYVLWRRGRKFLFAIIAIAILIMLTISALYSIPKFAVKKIMQA